jgi:ATP diphosphatase
MTKSARDIDALLEIMRRLRDKENGCPWDIEQSFETIAPYTIEEAYEVAGAIEEKNWAGLKEELGDLLLQAVYHARMAEERGLFDFGDVVEAVTAKMIARHPHVFADSGRIESAAAQTVAWEEHKRRERAEDPSASLLDGVPRALPALMRAEKLQRRAASVGFDWDSADKVLDKLKEEAAEIVAATREGAEPEKLADEVGDLLFVAVNLARHLKVDPETALRGTNAKFVRRFGVIERALAREGRTPADASLVEMEALWQAAKQEE